MAILLFKLQQVPDDEAADVRALLTENGIDFYETDAGFWRVGVDAIWLPDERQHEQAKSLLEVYQRNRTQDQRERFQALLDAGEAPTLWRRLLTRPFRFIGLVLAVLFVLAFTLLPFMAFLSNPG